MNLRDVESLVKKMSNETLLNMFATVSYQDIENPSLEKNAEWDIVKAEILERMK